MQTDKVVLLIKACGGRMMQEIKKLEIELHQFCARSNKTRLDQLIHESFHEIGYSGLMYSKQDILTYLLAEEASSDTVYSTDYQYKKLTDDVVQVLYKEARKDEQGRLSRYALRSSIWKNVAGQWQIIFHQATPTAAFS